MHPWWSGGRNRPYAHAFAQQITTRSGVALEQRLAEPAYGAET
jgi:hypothetical protein